MLTMRSALRTATFAGLCLLAATAHAQTALGTGFTYQGLVRLADAPVAGPADFQFSLWTAPNAGTQVGSTVAVNGLTLEDGRFTCHLDFGAAALNGDERYLQIAVRSPAGSGSFTTLAPRQRLTGTPYAVQTRGIFVDPAERVGIGTTAPTEMLHVAGGNLRLDRGANTESLTRNLTIGGARGLAGADFGQLDFANFDAGATALDYVGARIAARNAGDDDGELRFSTTSGGVLAERVAISPAGNLGIGVSTPSSPLSFANQLGEKIRLWGSGTNHFGFGIQGSLMQLYTDVQGADIAFGFGSSGAFTERMRVKGNGRVGIGTSTPQNPLHVVGNGDTLALEGTDHTFIEMFPDGFAAGRKAYIGFPGPTNDNIVINNETATGNIILRGSGNVGINLAPNATPTADLEVGGSVQVGDELLVPNGTIRRGGSAPSTTDLGLYSGTSGAWMRLVTNSGPIQFFTNSTQGAAVTPAVDSSVMTILANGNVGVGTSNPVAKFDVAGVARVNTLEIDAGADVAESYDVAPALTARGATPPTPGVVVSIDPRAVGKLVVSSTAYDTRVAGVISGAGDVQPGLVLAQPGTVADGDHPVASMGRVWCLVDADANGPVAAGDLLTSSATPGHAMKASNRELAPGATIGKAMSSLERGRGLVLVLISLQ